MTKPLQKIYGRTGVWYREPLDYKSNVQPTVLPGVQQILLILTDMRLFRFHLMFITKNQISSDVNYKSWIIRVSNMKDFVSQHLERAFHCIVYFNFSWEERWNLLSQVKSKPVVAICEQQRCISVYSDQCLCYLLSRPVDSLRIIQ